MSPPAVVAVLAGLLVLAAGLSCRPAAPAREPTPPDDDHCDGTREVVGDADEQAIVLLDTLYAELRSGTAYVTALLMALDRTPRVLPDVRTRLRRGVPPVAALCEPEPTPPLRRAPTTSSSTHVVLITCLAAAYRAGPGASAAVLSAAGVLRERRAWRLERRAQSASARLSARLLTALPPVVAGWSLLTDERTRAAYTTSAVPAVCAALGVALNLLGWRWTHRLVAGAA